MPRNQLRMICRYWGEEEHVGDSLVNFFTVSRLALANQLLHIQCWWQKDGG